MITLVINSYYRQGSTVVFKMLELSNPHSIVLCEPLHPNLFDILKRVKVGERDHLHGMPIWDHYFKIPYEYFIKLQEAHRDFTNVFEFKEVKQYLDILHSIPQEVMFKSTRLHFVLHDVARHYGCKTIHIVRNPANTWMDFLHISIKRNEKLFWKITLSRKMWNEIGNAFFLGSNYDAIKKRFNLHDVKNNFERFMITWTYCNYYGMKNADFILVYEVLLLKRSYYLKDINNVVGRIVFKPEYSYLPNKIIALEYPNRRSVLNVLFSQKLEDLGLYKMYKWMYDRINEQFIKYGIVNEYYPEV